MGWNRPAGADEVRLHLLVLRCQAGDEHAFRQLFDAYSGHTMNYIHAMVGDAADDVQQELWLAVFRSISSLSNPRAFRTWLFRSARHRALDFLRRAKREMQFIDDVPVDAIETAEIREDSPIPELGETDLGTALDCLSPLHREVLLLHYQDDLTYAEIALVVGIPIGTVRTRLHNGRRKLQDILKRGKK
jgi:RNA polymerase sigma-70 factor, ECF subfamily